MESGSDLHRGDVRPRLLTSLQRAVAEDGYRALTAGAIAAGADLPADSFDAHFESVADCYLAAFDLRAVQLEGILAAAWASEEEWPLRVRGTLGAALEYFSASPSAAALLLIEPLVADPEILRRHQTELARLVPFLAEGRSLAELGDDLPRWIEHALLGSLSSQIGRRASTGRADTLLELLPDLTQFVLTPYLGLTEAHRVAGG
ncbi:MAG TPA: TetR/AcrR family transcriptional regulator [Solirubrobacterales bacterium]|nr:TetR/AcrR family transcriptional regulator [Solirubrobacterales bacterium]